MSENTNKEKPEVYALHREGRDWQVSRRDFLKAAAIGAAALGAGMNSRLIRPVFAEDTRADFCKDAPAHTDPIKTMLLSADGRYLVTVDGQEKMKCWDFENTSLIADTKTTTFGRDYAEAAGIRNGKPVIIASRQDQFIYYELPLKVNMNSTSIPAKGTLLSPFVMTDEEDVYGIQDGTLYRLKKSGVGFGSPEKLYSFDKDQKPEDLKLLSGGTRMFFRMGSGCGVIDLRERKPFIIEGNCSAAAVVPGETNVLIAGDGKDSKYRLVSLISGETLWAQNLNTLKPAAGWPVPFDGIHAAAVTPDGSYAVLIVKCKGLKGGTNKTFSYVSLIDLRDGTMIRQLELESDTLDGIPMAGDGSKIAAAAEKSLVFISLPELEVIGCPVDLNEMKADTEGIEVSGTDPVTGKTVTYTLPCGAAIPAGAVCTCNCVSGYVCSCVGHCSCVGTCSCNSHRTTYTGSHYWHPN